MKSSGVKGGGGSVEVGGKGLGGGGGARGRFISRPLSSLLLVSLLLFKRASEAADLCRPTAIPMGMVALLSSPPEDDVTESGEVTVSLLGRRCFTIMDESLSFMRPLLEAEGLVNNESLGLKGPPRNELPPELHTEPGLCQEWMALGAERGPPPPLESRGEDVMIEIGWNDDVGVSDEAREDFLDDE
jgi:hypothetical protein